MNTNSSNLNNLGCTWRRLFLFLAIVSALLCAANSALAQTIVWQDTFERPDPTDQWGIDNGIWEFGAPLTGPATNSAGLRAHQGTNCAATILNGNYPANTSSRMIRITPFVVPAASNAPRLQFFHWYQFSGNSYGVVQIKSGTNAWADVSPRYYATSTAWTHPVVDLKAYAGKVVQVAFQIVSDGNVADGWCVDEVSYLTGPYQQPIIPNVAQGFELGIGDWSAETGTWEVGLPAYGPPTNALGRRAYAGSNCLATVLGGNYEDNRSSRFVSPPFVVPSVDQLPRLRFWEWFSIGANDYVQVQIRVGTNAWQGLSGAIALDSFDRWTRAFLDLAQYAGQTVQLGFYFESHSNPNYPYNGDPGPGWYVDEVLIETGPLPAFALPSQPEGFENGAGGWMVDYIGGPVTDFGIWEIGKPAYGPPANALGLRAHSGTNCAATVLGGDYPDNRSARLVSPPFVVPSAGQLPRLRFWQWYNIAGNDFCEMQIKVGTNAWKALHRYSGYGSGVWNQQGFDFTAYAGQTVQLGFYFESHSNPNYPYNGDPGPGWYVDDIALVTGPVQTVTPNIVEGFESAWKDWYAEDGTWEIGVPTYGPPTNALGRRAYAGTNCAATVLGGDYADNTSGRLVSPPFVVPSVGQHPSLRFWHWFSIGANDFCELQIKAGTNAWQSLSHYGPANSVVWTHSPSFDLAPYAGQSVQLGFYFESHSNPNYPYNGDPGPGWYIDEVFVSSVTPATGIVEFTDCRYFGNEGDGIATITVARKYGTSGPASVTYLASDGSAISPDDFDADVNTLTWADGEGGVKSFTVTIHQDALTEGNETVSLSLAVPAPLASVVARTTATLVIVDDDGVGPIVTNIAYLRTLVGTTNYVPTNTTTVFTVEGIVTTYTNLSLVASDELFFIQDGTNGIAVQWRGGTNQCFMPQAGDRLRVTAPLINANGLLVMAPAYTNINHYVWPLSSGNALPPAFALDFTTRTNVPTMETLEARYAIATNVWVSQTGGSTFPTVLTNILVTNQAGVTFDLTINPNTDIAGKPKPTQAVTILGVLNQNDPTAPYTTNYALLPTRYADIVGGDPGVIQWCPATYAILESGGTITLSACRTGASNGPVSANVSTATIIGTAIAGADFINTNGVLSWVNGESGVKTITVPIVNDSTEELDEYFFVNLSGPNVSSSLSQAQVVIVNDDFVVRLASVVTNVGGTVVFSVTPTTNTLGFQWWHNGLVQSGATNASFTLANVQLSDTGSNWVVVTTTLGAVTSSLGLLTVAVPVTLTCQPQSQTVPAGSPVSFCVCVSGSSTPPISYQWRRNGVPLAGQTNLCLAFAIAQISDSAIYSVVVNNLANQPVISANATLLVGDGTPVPTNGLGSYIVSNGCFVVTGSGEDIEGNEDRFFFVYSTLNGDGQTIAQLSGLVPDNSLSEAGIMLRDGLTGGDRHVFLAKNAANQVIFRRRHLANYDSLENAVRGTNVTWLRLMRMGDTFTGHSSSNGVNWDLIWWTTVPNMPASLQAGLAVTSHRFSAFATNTFCNWSVGGLTPLSGTWPLAGPKIHLGGEPAAYPSLQSLGGFKMLTSGVVGDQFSVKYATDVTTPFASWISLGVITNQYGVVPFVDSQALTNPRRFYRLERVGP